MPEQQLDVLGGRGTVPAVVWWPSAWAGRPRPPLVLVGHGGSGDKRSPCVVELAHWLSETAGLAALAIDGPRHGDRSMDTVAPTGKRTAATAPASRQDLRCMTDDWQAAILAVGRMGVARTDVLGYLGLSMGTRFGLPLAGALGSSLRCAVLGKFGLQQSGHMPQATEEEVAFIRAAAQSVTAPILFHVQWDDELFPREGQFELFNHIGCTDKRLVAYPGGHTATHPEAPSLWRQFLSQRLRSAAIAA